MKEFSVHIQVGQVRNSGPGRGCPETANGFSGKWQTRVSMINYPAIFRLCRSFCFDSPAGTGCRESVGIYPICPGPGIRYIFEPRRPKESLLLHAPTRRRVIGRFHADDHPILVAIRLWLPGAIRIVQMNPASTLNISLAKGEDHELESKRILVADDDASIRGCIAILLSRTGFEVETVQDGEEGWRAICNKEFDLVITDHEMPNMTGLNLIRKVREASIGAPCILISSSLPGTESTLMPLIRPGAVLTKPFRLDTLVKVVLSRLEPSTLQAACVQ